MLFKFYILEESITNYKDKINVCFYHSFYIYLKKYYPDICDFDTFLKFKDTNDYFTSIHQFILEYTKLYNYLIDIHFEIKHILDKLVLGICLLDENTKFVKLEGFIKLNYILDNKINFVSNIDKSDLPIFLLNDDEHFQPVILYN